MMNDNVNALYLSESVVKQMRESFRQSSVLLLPDFFTKSASDKIRVLLKSKGVERYVPHQYRYDELSGADLSFDFVAFVKEIIGEKISKKINVKRFGHRSFTLLHDDLEDDERLILFYTLTSGQWNASWGGSNIFTMGDGSEPIVFEPKSNSLAIIRVPKGMRNFVKYVNHFAGSNKIVLIEMSSVGNNAPARN